MSVLKQLRSYITNDRIQCVLTNYEIPLVFQIKFMMATFFCNQIKGLQQGGKMFSDESLIRT